MTELTRNFNFQVRGIEIVRDAERLVLRNTWASATLGSFYLLTGVGILCGIVFVVCVSPLTEGRHFDQPELSRVLALVSGLMGLLSLAALVLGLYRHRRPLILERGTNRFMDGSHEVCPLDEIADVRVASRGLDTTEYVVALVRHDGRSVNTLEDRLNTFDRREDAERLAGKLVDFLGGRGAK
jgi:hypothetical protein